MAILSDSGGTNAVHLYTHDYYRDPQMIAHAFDVCGGSVAAVHSLSSFNAEANFTRELLSFFSDKNRDTDVFLVQCVASECRSDHIEHVKVSFSFANPPLIKRIDMIAPRWLEFSVASIAHYCYDLVVLSHFCGAFTVVHKLAEKS